MLLQPSLLVTVNGSLWHRGQQVKQTPPGIISAAFLKHRWIYWQSDKGWVPALVRSYAVPSLSSNRSEVVQTTRGISSSLVSSVFHDLLLS